MESQCSFCVYESVCNDLVSASGSDSATMISAVIFVNGCNNPWITAICIHRWTSHTGPWEEEQRADGDIDRQLKVGPIHRGTARVSAANGES